MEEKKNWRPQKYTPKTLREQAELYFKNCDKLNEWLTDVRFKKPKTLSWLCLWLNVSKDYISEKAKDDNFSETIKEIRLVVENNIEEWILTNTYNSTSWIFNLKNNFDWKDKSEVDNTNTNFDATEMLNENQKSLIVKRYGNK